METIKQILVPDIGNFKDVEIIEVMVKAGDTVQAEDSLITIETDKATMDVPSPVSGIVQLVKVKKGDKVSEGVLIALIDESGDAAVKAIAPAPTPTFQNTSDADRAEAQHVGLKPDVQSITLINAIPVNEPAVTMPAPVTEGEGKAHASPSIRRYARELGVPLPQVTGSGIKGRVTKEDVQNFVKAVLVQPRDTAGLQIAEIQEVDGMTRCAQASDAGEQPPHLLPQTAGFTSNVSEANFAKYGAIECKPLSRIQKLSGTWLHRNWISIPHVTQHDEADITELEAFRQQIAKEYDTRGLKITLLAFLLKAVMEALQQFPDFNASLDASGENLVLKKYFHIGVAVNTPDGLVVPVLRDVNQKGIVQLAKELGEISTRARDKKISAAEMQGGCFTISSLGGIGGTAFTPIINAPEVAILGVSKSGIKPVWQEGKFEPRLMLPLSLSYDHRVIDGVAGVRFTTYLAQVLSDVRRLAL